ncbi:MAG: GatB/YqeY domain-containing protein [Acidobacteriota bacterium]|nr:GatB/YqeY domain-containing protein [Acidobacteriota bacterium]
MSSHRELVQAQIAEALKARDTARLSTLRLLLSEVKNKAIELGAEVSEDDFLRVVHKGIKQRQESAKQYLEGGRDELAAKEQAESEVLEGFLPPQASEEEIRAAITEFLASSEVTGPAAIGAVMKAMMQRFAGSADRGTLSRLAREILG